MKQIFYIDNNNLNNISFEFKETIKNTISKRRFANEILNFIEILEKDKDIDLNIFYQNLLSLKILKGDCYFKDSKIRNFLKGGKQLAYHQIITNQIVLRDNYIENSLNHELFHVASSIYSKNDEVVFSGLFQSSSKHLFHIGRALNEGYTELLCQRYFPSIFNYCYQEELKIASLIEELVGKQIMYDCYFKANLPRLIDYLSSFDNKENVIAFLCEEPRKYPNKYIKDFVKNNYLNKIYNDYNNKLLNEKELINKIARCYYFLGDKKVDNNIKCIFSSKEINSKINEKIKYMKIREKNRFI